jgi:hypothetical protein
MIFRTKACEPSTEKETETPQDRDFANASQPITPGENERAGI